MRIPILFAVFGAVSHAATHTAPTEVGLIVEPIVAFDTAKDRAQEDTFVTWTRLHATAGQRLSTSRWFLAVDGEHELRVGEDVEGLWNVRAGESGWAGKVGAMHLRTGVLVERWGKLDLLPVVDVLNPRDLVAGPMTNVESTRIPIAMTRLQAKAGPVRGELTLIPFAGVDRADLIGSDWSLIRPGMLEGYITEMQGWQGGVGVLASDPLSRLNTGIENTQPSTLRAMNDAMRDGGLPEAFIANGEAALRIEAEGRGVDGALMAGALRNRTPAIEMAPQLRTVLKRGSWPDLDELGALSASIDEPLTTTWHRTAMLGGELNTVTGPLGWRFEGAYLSNSVVQERWFSSTTSPLVRTGLGLDWAHQTTVFISLEGRWQRLLRPPETPLLTAANTVDLAAMVRLALFQDRVELISATVIDPIRLEYLTRPQVRWRISDPLSIGVGAVLLGGNTPPPSTLTEAMDYSGGPFGYFGDNDCVFSTLRWIH